MAEESIDNTHGELNNQTLTDSEAKGPDNFYEELNEQIHSDFLKLKEMEEGSFKMRKEVALLQLDVASTINPHLFKAESIFEANVIKASETVQEIESIMSKELEELSDLLSESNSLFEC